MKKTIEKLAYFKELFTLIWRKYGLKGTLQFIYQDILTDFFRKLDTFIPVPREELFDKSVVMLQNRYVPSTYIIIDKMIALAKDKVDFAAANFIDIGSGKGKVLIGASKYNFKKLKGIEYSEKLHSIAEKNISTLGLEGRVELLNIDAKNYTPDVEDKVFYFFNPFMGSILDDVLRNISRADNGGKPRVYLYLNPVDDEIFCKYFKKLDELIIQPGNLNVNYYMDK